MLPAEMDKIFVIPRFHLELLLNGTATHENLKSISGLLNIGTGLAEVRHDVQLMDEVQSAVALLIDAACHKPPRLEESKVDVFLALTRKIEAIARRTPRARFMQAVYYVLTVPADRVEIMDVVPDEAPQEGVQPSA